MLLEGGSDVREQHKWSVLVRLGQGGSEGFEDAKLGQECAAIVHVGLVFTRPMKCFPGQDLQPIEIDAMAFVKLNVTFREIFSDNADQFHRAEKAGGHG